MKHISQIITQAVLKLENHRYDAPKSYDLIYMGKTVLTGATYKQCSDTQGAMKGDNNLFIIRPNFE